MPPKPLKSVPTAIEAPHPSPARAPARLAPDTLRRLAAGADPSQPPAVMPAQSTLITLRVQIALADAIAEAAEAEGTTQKVIITRALAAAGFNVAPADLEDRTPRRRARGAA